MNSNEIDHGGRTGSLFWQCAHHDIHNSKFMNHWIRCFKLMLIIVLILYKSHAVHKAFLTSLVVIVLAYWSDCYSTAWVDYTIGTYLYHLNTGLLVVQFDGKGKEKEIQNKNKSLPYFPRLSTPGPSYKQGQEGLLPCLSSRRMSLSRLKFAWSKPWRILNSLITAYDKMNLSSCVVPNLILACGC